MINISKKKSLLVYVLFYCTVSHTMEIREIRERIKTIKIEEIKIDHEIKLKNEWSLFDFIQAGEIASIEEKLPSSEFDFIELVKSYTFALEQIKTLTPNKKLRSADFMQEAIKKIQSQRMIALDRLLIFDAFNTRRNENVHTKKSRRKQINETLIDQGKLFSECAQKIYPYIEPFLIDIENLNFFFFHIGVIGHLDSMKDFITKYESDIDWNCCDEKGKTLLHIHAKEGNLDMVDYLLSKQIDCNKQTYYDGNPHKTALHYAAKYHQSTIVIRLICYDCDVTITDYFGQLPLHYVAPGKNGNQEIFEHLIVGGTDIDSKSDDGSTLLYIAVESNNPDTVEYLLILGANPHKKSKYIPNETESYWDTPLELAVRKSFVARLNKEENYEKNNNIILELLQEYSFKEIDLEKRHRINRTNELL